MVLIRARLRLAPTPRVTSLYLFPRPQAAAALSKGRAAPCSDQHQIWLQPSARYGRFSRGPLAPPGPTDKFPSLSCGCECRNIRFIDNRSRLLVGTSSGEQGSATHHDVFLGRCTRLGRMGCRVSSIVPTRFGVSITKLLNAAYDRWLKTSDDSAVAAGAAKVRASGGPLHRYSRQKSLNRVGASSV